MGVGGRHGVAKVRFQFNKSTLDKVNIQPYFHFPIRSYQDYPVICIRIYNLKCYQRIKHYPNFGFSLIDRDRARGPSLILRKITPLSMFRIFQMSLNDKYSTRAIANGYEHGANFGCHANPSSVVGIDRHFLPEIRTRNGINPRH